MQGFDPEQTRHGAPGPGKKGVIAVAALLTMIGVISELKDAAYSRGNLLEAKETKRIADVIRSLGEFMDHALLRDAGFADYYEASMKSHVWRSVGKLVRTPFSLPGGTA